MFAPVLVEEGTFVVPDAPGADEPWSVDASWVEPASVDGPDRGVFAVALLPEDLRVQVVRFFDALGEELGREAWGAAGVGALPADPLADLWWTDVEAVDARAWTGCAVPEDPPALEEEELLGLAGAPWQSLAELERAVPGADLALVLEMVDVATLEDASVVEVVAAAEKLASWAHLVAAEGAAELAGRASMNPDWNRPIPTRTCVAGDELAMRLGWSRPAAARLVRDGLALGNELLLVAEAVRAGLVDSQKLRVLTDRLHDRPGQLAWAVQEAVLPEVATRTPTQLAADIDRALLAIDPEDAALRLPKAIAARHVCHPRRLPDGMAGLWAVLPAIDAARIDGTLEATARAARALGDPRTLDQLRADTLVDLASGTALLAGVAPAATGGTRPGDRFDDAAVVVFGPDGEVSVDRAGSLHRPAAPDADGRPGAGGADAQPGADLVGDEPPGGPDRGPGLDDQHEADVGPPGRRAPGIRVPKVRIDVTVALSTLLGLDDQPGELAGLGPISAEQARALAAGGIWRRIVTDPLTGAVLDVGRTRYRPPRPLAEHVLARDGVCAAPGCSVPGHRCDLDHTTEYYGVPANGSPERGGTSAANLGPLSDRCHRLKTDGGFTLTQVQPGVFEWRTPAGLAYRVTPGDFGRTTKLAKRSSLPDEPPF